MLHRSVVDIVKSNRCEERGVRAVLHTEVSLHIDIPLSIMKRFYYL